MGPVSESEEQSQLSAVGRKSEARSSESERKEIEKTKPISMVALATEGSEGTERVSGLDYMAGSEQKMKKQSQFANLQEAISVQAYESVVDLKKQSQFVGRMN
jgi:hypothetical protein